MVAKNIYTLKPLLHNYIFMLKFHKIPNENIQLILMAPFIYLSPECSINTLKIKCLPVLRDDNVLYILKDYIVILLDNDVSDNQLFIKTENGIEKAEPLITGYDKFFKLYYRIIDVNSSKILKDIYDNIVHYSEEDNKFYSYYSKIHKNIKKDIINFYNDRLNSTILLHSILNPDIDSFVKMYDTRLDKDTVKKAVSHHNQIISAIDIWSNVYNIDNYSFLKLSKDDNIYRLVIDKRKYTIIKERTGTEYIRDRNTEIEERASI